MDLWADYGILLDTIKQQSVKLGQVLLLTNLGMLKGSIRVCKGILAVEYVKHSVQLPLT